MLIPTREQLIQENNELLEIIEELSNDYGEAVFEIITIKEESRKLKEALQVALERLQELRVL